MPRSKQRIEFPEDIGEKLDTLEMVFLAFQKFLGPDNNSTAPKESLLIAEVLSLVGYYKYLAGGDRKAFEEQLNSFLQTLDPQLKKTRKHSTPFLDRISASFKHIHNFNESEYPDTIVQLMDELLKQKPYLVIEKYLTQIMQEYPKLSDQLTPSENSTKYTELRMMLMALHRILSASLSSCTENPAFLSIINEVLQMTLPSFKKTQQDLAVLCEKHRYPAGPYIKDIADSIALIQANIMPVLVHFVEPWVQAYPKIITDKKSNRSTFEKYNRSTLTLTPLITEFNSTVQNYNAYEREAIEDNTKFSLQTTKKFLKEFRQIIQTFSVHYPVFDTMIQNIVTDLSPQTSAFFTKVTTPSLKLETYQRISQQNYDRKVVQESQRQAMLFTRYSQKLDVKIQMIRRSEAPLRKAKSAPVTPRPKYSTLSFNQASPSIRTFS